MIMENKFLQEVGKKIRIARITNSKDKLQWKSFWGCSPDISDFIARPYRHCSDSVDQHASFTFSLPFQLISLQAQFL